MNDIDAIGTDLSAGRIILKEAEHKEDVLAERIRRLSEDEARTIAFPGGFDPLWRNFIWAHKM